MSLRSYCFFTMFLSSAMNMSVTSVCSWASRIIVEYHSSDRWLITYRRSIPSVMYLRKVVLCSVMPLKCMEYPTSSPSCARRGIRCVLLIPINECTPFFSSAMRFAMDMATTRHSCVHAIIFPFAMQSEYAANCGIREAGYVTSKWGCTIDEERGCG